MNFSDRKVRARVMTHITFAVESATAGFADLEKEEDKEIKAILETLKVPVIMQVLNFTLNLDYQLKNTLTGSDKGLE